MFKGKIKPKLIPLFLAIMMAVMPIMQMPVFAADTPQAPTWASTYPKAGTTGSTSAQVLVKTDMNGKAYYVVLPNNSQAPSTAEVKAGTGKNGASALKSGNVTLAANTEATISITGLSLHFINDVYIVAEDDSATPNVQAAPVKVDITANDVVAYYEFENNTNDSSKGNNATLSGTAATYAAGVNGNAICLSGSTSIVMPYQMLWNHPNFTVIARFKTLSPGGLLGYQNAAAGQSAPSQFVPILSIQSDGILAAELWTDNNGIKVYSSTAVNDNKWHKVAISASANSITVYLDDVQIGTKTGNVLPLQMYYNQIGSNDGAVRDNQVQGWQYFNGLIDDVYVLDGGLSGQEIQQMTSSLALGSTTIHEAAANDGSIADTQTVTLTNGTFVGTNGQAMAGVTVNNLPAGLTATAVKDSDTQITISFSGLATHHTAADSVANASVTIAQTDINGAPEDLTSGSFAFSFLDPYSGNCDLSGLTVSAGTLSPAFGSGTTAYAVTVGSGVNSIMVTPTVSDTGRATVTVNGTATTSGYASAAISLNTGSNSISIVVTAQSGATKTYTITVTRSASQYTVTFDSNSGSVVNPQSVTSGGMASKPSDPVKTGYSFNGWYSDSGLTSSYDFNTPITGDITLYAKWTANTYNITYNGNGNTGGTAPSSQSGSYNSSITLQTNSGNMTKTGYNFAGWNTAANDSGNSYAAGASFSIPAGDMTLYAQWTVYSYSVSYDGNGNTGGSVPAASNFNYGSTVTVSDAGSLVKTGYTFAGWNTQPNGSGTNYAASDTFPMGTASVTLYAQWTVNTYTVAYDANGGSGDIPATSSSYGYGSTVNVLGNVGTTPLTKTGFSFSGWNASRDLTGTGYSAGGVFHMPGHDVTLYAQWTANSYSVSYDGNGNTGGTVPAASNYNYNVTVTASVYGSLERTGYTFAGWNTKADGTGTPYAQDDTFAMGTANVTLYAQWSINNYTVTYDGNGSDGGTTPAGASFIYNTNVSVSDCTYSKTGYSFIEWNTAPDGSGTSYTAGANFTIPANNITLYAKWTSAGSGVSGTGGGGSGGNSSKPSSGNTDVLLNGETKGITGTSTTETGADGQTTTTVTLDEKKIAEILDTLPDNGGSTGKPSVLSIPVGNDGDVVVGELTGQMVKDMEGKNVVIEIKTDLATYTIAAEQVKIDEVSAKLGTQVELKDITVHIEISKPSAETTRVVENSAKAGEYTIVTPPVDFTVKCTYGDKTVEVSQFNAYVERTIAIPDGVDPAKITTGVVIDPDGTVRHVPTKITVADGKYYAQINSLTNSTYSVIWHPVEFKDVTNHWAKDAINDMGSRMVISGVGNDMFDPDRDITRAEFAAIIVKALGLKPGTGSNPFTDVSNTAWYCDYIKTAVEYKIISGYGDSKFGPNDKITREQAMTMVARAMNITGLKVQFTNGEMDKLLASYGDAAKSADYAKNNIAACVKTGIITGRNGNLVAPKDNITRAEVAVIVRRLLQKSGLI